MTRKEQEQIPAALCLLLAENWDFGALHLCHIGTNPASPGWRSTLVYKHTRFAITALCAYKPLLPRQTKPKPIYWFRFLFYLTFLDSRDLNKSVQKQSSELFLAMTTKQRAIKRLSFELLVRSGRSANKTEALSKTHSYICTLVLRNARTNPCFSLFLGE